MKIVLDLVVKMLSTVMKIQEVKQPDTSAAKIKTLGG